MCFSLDLPNSQLAKLAIQGLQPYLKERLVGVYFDDLNTLSQRVAALSEYVQQTRKDGRFQKSANVADYYDAMLQYNSDEEDDINAIEWNWGKKQFIINHP
jgi:hypothetical protein